MDDESEQTWGNAVPGPTPNPSRSTPAVNPMPNQRSMPVVGQPAASRPHVGHQAPVNPQYPTPSPAPNPTHPVVPPTNYPAAYPAVNPVVPPQYPGSQQQPPAGYPVGPPRESFISRLMQRGVRGELLRQPWFHDMRVRNADTFVYVSFAVGVVLTIMFSLIPSSFVVTVLTTAFWGGIGYLYFALGTKLAHQFILFGICLVGGLVMATRTLSAMFALSQPRWRYDGYLAESVPELSFVLLINLAGAAVAVYVGVQVWRGIQQMSQP